MGTLGSNAINVAFMLFMVVIVVSIVAFGFWAWSTYRKYSQYKVVIWEKDALGVINQHNDKAGVFVDRRTHNKLLFLKKSKVCMDPDHIPSVGAGKNRTIYLYRNGLKDFRFVKPSFREDVLNYTVGEEDLNWALNGYDRQKKSIWSDKFMQIFPLIVMAFVAIGILVMVSYLLRRVDLIVSSGVEVADSLRIAAEALAAANSGTTVVPA